MWNEYERGMKSLNLNFLAKTEPSRLVFWIKLLNHYETIEPHNTMLDARNVLCYQTKVLTGV